MHIAVVDDERPARSELRYLIEKLLPEACIEEIKSGKELVEKVFEIPFDCIFLDIHLGDMAGIELVSIIRRVLPDVSIVFATAYNEFAVKAFEVDAIDYIMKPFEEARVAATIKKLVSYHNKREREKVLKEGEQGNLIRSIGKLAISIDKKLILIGIQDIAYIEVDDKNCNIYTNKGVLKSNQCLKYFEEKLSNEYFLRINKGYIINLQYVVEIEPSFNNIYVVKLKGFERKPLEVSRNHIKKLKESFKS